MPFYDKNKEYLIELYENYSINEEFKDFEKNFKDFKKEEIVRMYIVKKSNDVKQINYNTDVEKIDKVEKLEFIGKYLDKTGELDRLIEEQNQEILKKLGKDIGKTEDKNPFLINKEQVLNEFDVENNFEKSQENINLKLAFWTNRFVKTLESVKRSNLDNMIQDKGDKRKVIRNLNSIQDIIAVKNPNYYETYNKFLNGKINKNQFEQSKEFRKMTEIIDKNKRRQGIEYNEYELFDMASIDNNIALGYLEKSNIIKDISLEKNSLEVKSYKDINIKGNYKVVNIKSKEDKFNMEVSLHNRIEEIEKIEKDKNSNIKVMDEKQDFPAIKNIVLTEIPDEKIPQIKYILNKKGKYSFKTKKILSQYREILGIKTKNNFIEELEEKVNKNPKYLNNIDNNGKDIEKEIEDRGDR